MSVDILLQLWFLLLFRILVFFFGFSLVGSDILLMTNRLSAFLCFSPSILFFFSVCLFVIVD